jgi:hypothetical protein
VPSEAQAHCPAALLLLLLLLHSLALPFDAANPQQFINMDLDALIAQLHSLPIQSKSKSAKKLHASSENNSNSNSSTRNNNGAINPLSLSDSDHNDNNNTIKPSSSQTNPSSPSNLKYLLSLGQDISREERNARVQKLLAKQKLQTADSHSSSTTSGQSSARGSPLPGDEEKKGNNYSIQISPPPPSADPVPPASTHKHVGPTENQFDEAKKNYEALSLTYILAHPIGIKFFKAYLAKEFSSENLNYWNELNNWKYTADNKTLIAKCKQIIKIYIKPDAEQSINITSATRSKILLVEIDDNNANNCFAELMQGFLDAQKEITELMRKDSFRRFKISPPFNDFIKELEQHNDAGYRRKSHSVASKSSSQNHADSSAGMDLDAILGVLSTAMANNPDNNKTRKSTSHHRQARSVAFNSSSPILPIKENVLSHISSDTSKDDFLDFTASNSSFRGRSVSSAASAPSLTLRPLNFSLSNSIENKDQQSILSRSSVSTTSFSEQP